MACEHCGEVSLAIQEWPQYVHDNCDCLCHGWRSKKGRDAWEQQKKEARKRKKK